MRALFHRRWVLSRSLLRETIPTLILACGVTTFLLVIRQLFLIADLFISRDVRPQTALWLIGLALPNILALTLPIGTLFAVMMTVSRLSSDSELVALQACGLPLTRTLRPLLALAGVVFAVNAVLSRGVLPASNRKFSEMSRRIYFSAAKATIQPKVFIEDFPQKLLYLDSIDPENGRWHGVLLFDLSDPLEERLVVADSGELTSDSISGSAKLELRDLAQHVFRVDEPDKHQRNDIREQTVWLMSPSPEGTQTHTYGVKETGSAELVARSLDPKSKQSERLEAAWEAHKRLAIPAAALAFAVVGFPLGVRNRRVGRGSALTASVGLVVAYYILLNIGETLATEGRVPVLLCAWIPNLILLAIGYALIARARNAARTHHWLSLAGSAFIAGAAVRAIDLAVRFLHRVPFFASRHGSAATEIALTQEPMRSGRNGRLRWPVCILDGYVLRQCAVFLALVLVAVCALWLVVNLSEELEHIRTNHVPLLTVASYYLVSLPQILHDILPLAFLIAFLGTATVLERRNETTALKASGVSVTRVVTPLLA
ncbi:MAG: LptF/LptG family permease, partial [Acidobacteria bacterium]|nr:LptF/LptG family permease [Acidobacteriota bacterium]